MDDLYAARSSSGATIDVWLTLAGWVWVLYLALIAATGSALLLAP